MNAAAISTARDFISRTYPGIQLPQCSYLVLMSARSGSMLLCAQLEKAGFGRPVEAFNSNKNPMFHNVWDIDYSNDHD
ncbi:MAG TPA: Stf0 family sulfotransferase, partial [Anaerolineaceae bacterium]|nr:Stf0 family sulfotransferase [Anaerolineaceae bacterium]